MPPTAVQMTQTAIFAVFLCFIALSRSQTLTFNGTFVGFPSAVSPAQMWTLMNGRSFTATGGSVPAAGSLAGLCYIGNSFAYPSSCGLGGLGYAQAVCSSNGTHINGIVNVNIGSISVQASYYPCVLNTTAWTLSINSNTWTRSTGSGFIYLPGPPSLYGSSQSLRRPGVVNLTLSGQGLPLTASENPIVTLRTDCTTTGPLTCTVTSTSQTSIQCDGLDLSVLSNDLPTGCTIYANASRYGVLTSEAVVGVAYSSTSCGFRSFTFLLFLSARRCCGHTQHNPQSLGRYKLCLLRQPDDRGQ